MKISKLRYLILFGYLALLLLFVIFGGIVFSTVVGTAKQQDQVEIAQVTLLKANQALLGLSTMSRSVREQILFPKDAAYQERYQEGLLLFEQASLELENRIQNTQQQERWNNLTAEAKQLKERSDQAFKFVRAGQIDQATNQIQQSNLPRINQLYSELLSQETTTLAQQREEARAAANFLILVIVLGTVLSAIAAIAMSGLITRSVDRKLQESAKNITGASDQITIAMHQQERIVSSQVAAVHETTETMDDVESACRLSSQKAQSAAVTASGVLGLAEQGTEAVNQTLQGIFSMEQKVDAIAEQTVSLREKAMQIVGISQVVSELANQTNMLALNSSMEAVRAGEYGKGFAVVAGEIRRLSEQSEQSAGEIRNLVTEIQKAINATVKVTDEGIKTTKAGVQIAQRTAELFTGVSEGVNTVVLDNEQVALNLQQQVNAIQQVVEAMEHLNKGARETEQGLNEVGTSTRRLDQAASVLKRLT